MPEMPKAKEEAQAPFAPIETAIMVNGEPAEVAKFGRAMRDGETGRHVMVYVTREEVEAAAAEGRDPELSIMDWVTFNRSENDALTELEPEPPADIDADGDGGSGEGEGDAA